MSIQDISHACLLDHDVEESITSSVPRSYPEVYAWFISTLPLIISCFQLRRKSLQNHLQPQYSIQPTILQNPLQPQYSIQPTILQNPLQSQYSIHPTILQNPLQSQCSIQPTSLQILIQSSDPAIVQPTDLDIVQ